MIISVTEFRVKNVLLVPRFLRYAVASGKEASNSKGNLFFETKSKSWHTFKTLTAWEDQEAMKSFIVGGKHLEAMKRSAAMAKTTRSIHYESNHIPSWEEALKMLEGVNLRHY